jgi:hypothetical protein
VCAGLGSPASARVPGDAGPGSVPGSPSPGIRSTAGPGAPGAVGSVSAGASSAGDAAVSAAPLGASGGGSAAGGGADPGGSDVSRSGGSLFTLPRGRDARLVAAARPVLPYIAGALVLVAVGSVLVGVRRRRSEAWADAAAGWFGPGNTGRHRRA